MSIQLRRQPRAEIGVRSVGSAPRGWLGWLTTTDHKRIGVLYLVATFGFFLLGGAEALLLRLQLGAPNNTLLQAEKYNALMTMHGTTMVFLFVVPVWAGFANYMVPLMIGARDVAFPRLNALSFWLLLAGGIVFYASLFSSPPEAGWTSYTPLSTGDYIPGSGQDAWIYLIHLTSLSSMIGATNLPGRCRWLVGERPAARARRP
jgi:heme/copper-type cytochrome/quinol oxidase subunit 1